MICSSDCSVKRDNSNKKTKLKPLQESRQEITGAAATGDREEWNVLSQDRTKVADESML